jgi:hypothetical protein
MRVGEVLLLPVQLPVEVEELTHAVGGVLLLLGLVLLRGRGVDPCGAGSPSCLSLNS